MRNILRIFEIILANEVNTLHL